MEDPEVKPGPEVEGINLDLLTDGQQQGEGEDGDPSNRTEELTPRIKLAPVNSDPKPWSEELQLEWSIDLVRDDLLTLRDFFKQGMDFTVVEQVVSFGRFFSWLSVAFAHSFCCLLKMKTQY